MHEWWQTLLESDGLLLRDRALTAVDPDDLLTALRSGRLRRLQRGVYLPRRAEATPLVVARAALRDSGVPLPIPQYCLRAPDGTVIARLDGAYLRQKVALEFDGAEPHGLPEAVFRDRLRQNRLPELGWTVLRFTWWDVMRDPTGVAATVQRTLRRRAA
jgi:hypothetical protein